MVKRHKLLFKCADLSTCPPCTCKVKICIYNAFHVPICLHVDQRPIFESKYLLKIARLSFDILARWCMGKSFRSFFLFIFFIIMNYMTILVPCTLLIRNHLIRKNHNYFSSLIIRLRTSWRHRGTLRNHCFVHFTNKFIQYTLNTN